MAIIKTDAPSMSEVLCGIRLRKAQNTFLNQIDKIVDWRPIRTFINKNTLRRCYQTVHEEEILQVERRYIYLDSCF